jgi:prefoldin alpha subunit
MDQSLLEKAQLLHKESEALEERKSFVEQHFSELTTFNEQLDSMASAKGEILASLGRGVFVKADIKTKDFFVDIGSGVVVKKHLGDVQAIIKEQIEGLEKLRGETNKRLAELQEEFKAIVDTIKK